MKHLIRMTTSVCLIFGAGLGVGIVSMLKLGVMQKPETLIFRQHELVRDPAPEYHITYTPEDDLSWLNNVPAENLPCLTTLMLKSVIGPDGMCIEVTAPVITSPPLLPSPTPPPTSSAPAPSSVAAPGVPLTETAPTVTPPSTVPPADVTTTTGTPPSTDTTTSTTMVGE
jgi:hypothetical protein